MNNLKFSLLAVAMLLCTAVSAQTVDEVNAKFNEAGALINAKNYAEAIPALEAVIDMGQKVGAEALETTEQCQKLLPTLYLTYGRQLAGAQKFDDAIANLKKAEDYGELYGVPAAKNNASNTISQIYLMMGGEAYNSGDYAKAIEVFSKGYEAAPNNTQLALYLAESYDKVDSLSQAMEIYKGIMALTHSRYAADVEKAKTELATTLLARAAAAAGTNNLDGVVKYTGDILEFDPANADATLLRVQVANNAKNYAKVIEYGPAAIEAQTDPVKKSTAYFLVGAAYQNTDNKAKAIEAFKNVTAGDNVAQAKKLIADLSK